MYDPLMIDAWNINVLMGRFLQFQVAMSTQDVLVATRYPIAHTADAQARSLATYCSSEIASAVSGR